jgi:hypothetical protein
MTTPNAAGHTPRENFGALLHDLRVLDEAQIGFIVGPPKTGTSWLGWAISSHPHALARGEGQFGNMLLPRIESALDQYVEERRKWGLQTTFLGSAERGSIERLAIAQVLLGYLRQDGRPVDSMRCIIDRTPGGAVHIPRLASLFPNAKFLCTTRDPRDAGVSFWFHWIRVHGELKGVSLYDFVERNTREGWSSTIRAARDAASSLGPDRYLELDYAEHHADRRGTVIRLLRFLGLDADADTVDLVLNGSDFRTRSGGRAPGQEDRANFCRKGVVGDWRNHLSAQEGDRIMAIAAECLGAHAAILDRYRAAPESVSAA